MPRRPPKKWMRDCVAGVTKNSPAYDPRAVCGSLWYHKLSPAQKAAAVRRERTRRTESFHSRASLDPGYWAMHPDGEPAAGAFATRLKADSIAKLIGGYVQYEPLRRTRSKTSKKKT